MELVALEEDEGAGRKDKYKTKGIGVKSET